MSARSGELVTVGSEAGSTGVREGAEMANTKTQSYVVEQGISIYTVLFHLLRSKVSRPIRHIIVSRWSRDGDDANAGEQLSKTLAPQLKLVPAVNLLLATVRDEAWNSTAGRERHGIFEVCIRDVTPYRFPDDPSGKQLIGYAIVVDDTLVFRVSSSGFKTILREDGEELNPYLQSVIEILKYATAHSGGTSVCLRLAEDHKRKGRHIAELARLDNWVERLRIRLFYGSREIDLGGFGRLIESLTNHDAASNRTEVVESLTMGLLAATTKGYIPSSILNLPPYLTHVEDPNAAGLDRRRREGSSLVVDWDVKVFPALQEYVSAFARGAGRKELVAILRRHKVPTPRSLAPSGEKVRYSTQRDTTFDQIDIEEATVRASRWLTYSDHPYRSVPGDAATEERMKLDLGNELAVRKISMLLTGEYMFKYRNPTPTKDAIGDFDVERSGPLDAGVVKTLITMPWPDKRKVITGENGVPTVTDEIERDADGNPIPWEHCGCDPELLAKCIERLRRTATEGSTRDSGAMNKGMVRLLDIARWTTRESDGSERQWEMWCRGRSASTRAEGTSAGQWRTRWLVWRPSPDPTDPSSALNLGWRSHHIEMSRKDNPHPERHVATIREDLLVKSLYDALHDGVVRVLDHDEPLAIVSTSSALSSERAATVERLLVQATASEEAATKCRRMADGYEDTAMEARATGDTSEYTRMRERADGKRTEAHQHDDEAMRLRAAASELETDEEGELSVTTVAHLIELVRRSADELGGHVPANIAAVISPCFTNWRILPGDGISCPWTCNALLRLVDGRTVELPLTGIVANTRYGNGSKDPHTQQLLSKLLSGESLDDIAAEGRLRSRSTTRPSLYRAATRLLIKRGVAPELAGPLLDHPHSTAIKALWAALTGDRPAGYHWGPAFERHLKAVYCSADARWAAAACPTKHGHAILRVFAVVQQHPSAVAVADIVNAADVSESFVKRLVTPQAGGIGWPKMLNWVEGQEGRTVCAIPCPHVDCRGIHPRATVPVFLPETAPEARGVGGVLCATCSRLPRQDHASVVFPPEWQLPVCAVSPDGRYGARAARITHVVKHPTVPVVQPAPTVIRLEELVAEFGIGRVKAKQILTSAGIEPRRERGRGRDGSRLYPPTARTALAIWMSTCDPEARGDGIRVRTLAAEFGIGRDRITEVLQAAGIKPLDARARGKGGGALYPSEAARTALATRSVNSYGQARDPNISPED